jgi:D-lactate dehydrogenase
VSLDDALTQADIVTPHCPLTAATKHLVDARRLAAMKPGAMLINTSRGGLVDTKALIAALKRRHLGAVGLDVYEEEAGLFDRDLSERGIDDDVFARLLTFPNVLVTAHQGFLTREALTQIAATTVMNLQAIARATPVPERELG